MQVQVEKLRNYYEMSKHLYDEIQKAELKNILGISTEDEKRLKGFENETEFKLIIYALGHVKRFVAIDESANKLTNTKTSDFLVVTDTGRKLSIEVKSSKNAEIEFTRSLVSQEEEFSKGLGYESYFAIKLSGHWMLFNSDYIIKQNYKISLNKDYLSSELGEIFGEMLILFPKGLKLFTYYSHTKRGLGIHHNEYGEASRIKIKIPRRESYNITANCPKNLVLSFILENVEDVMSNQKQIIRKIDSDNTLVIEEFAHENNLLLLSAFILAPIKHIINEETKKGYTYEQFIEYLKNNNHTLTEPKVVLAALGMLNSKTYPLIVFKGNNGYSLESLL